jgi:hypothetical protein
MEFSNAHGDAKLLRLVEDDTAALRGVASRKV